MCGDSKKTAPSTPEGAYSIMIKALPPITTLTADQEVTDHEYGDTDTINIPVSLVNDFRCGGVDDQFTMRFSVSARGLDHGGFVYEVASLIAAVRDAYRPERGTLKASCEELAAGVVNVFQRVIGSRLVAAHVEVDNLTGHVAVDWKEGDAAASFPRLASPSEQKATKLDRYDSDPPPAPVRYEEPRARSLSDVC